MRIQLLVYMGCLICWAMAWVQSTDISNLLISALPFNLTDFIIASSDNPSLMVIQGGSINGKNSNRTFLLDIISNSSVEITSDPRPNLIHSCACIYNGFFYLYGSTEETNNSTTEIWRLDLTSSVWSMLTQGLDPLKHCEIYDSPEGGLVIAGQALNSELSLFLLDLQNFRLSTFSVSFISYAIFETVLWDGSTVKNSISIQQAPTNAIAYASSGLSLTIYGSLHISGSTNPSIKYLQANGQIYSLSYLNSSWIEVKFLSFIEKNIKSQVSKAVNWRQWSIYCTLSKDKSFYMEYINQATHFHQRVSSKTINFYTRSWPNFNNASGNYSLLLTTSSSILLIIHTGYTAYLLHQNVYQANGTASPGLASTFFGLNQCHPGWRLPDCKSPTCANTLVLDSSDGLKSLQFQCSGHGVCDNGTCVCESLWGGADCSVYLRKKCSGVLTDNFPLNNCECMEATLGGNDCGIRFCPNGCTGHGACSNGSCICDSNYYGSDCSIMIVGFPS